MAINATNGVGGGVDVALLTLGKIKEWEKTYECDGSKVKISVKGESAVITGNVEVNGEERQVRITVNLKTKQATLEVQEADGSWRTVATGRNAIKEARKITGKLLQSNADDKDLRALHRILTGGGSGQKKAGPSKRAMT